MTTQTHRTRTTRLVAGAAALASLVALGACAGPGATASPSTTASPAAPSTTATTPPASAEPTAIAAEPTAVAAAGDTARLGFNNAGQMAATTDGTVLSTWVDGDDVVVASSQGADTPSSTTVVASGRTPTLPGIAADGALVVVTWLEGARVMASLSSDAGVTWSAPVELGTGGGPAGAVDDGHVVVVWHTGSEEAGSTITLASWDGQGWSSPVRVDESDASPVWASVAVDGDDVVVTWRDDRTGSYSVWLRHSGDGGLTWDDEVHVVTSTSGDPDVCIGDDGAAWVGYHGRGAITVVHSADGGATFGSPVTVGRGWFAHVDCVAGGVLVAWEGTEGQAKAAGKEAAWAFVDGTGTVTATGTASDPAVTDTAATTALATAPGQAVVAWVVPGAEPLVGTLWWQEVAW